MGKLEELECIVFDFDGVLTNNMVWVDENGKESVMCNRADGLGLDFLRKTDIKLFILSTETNQVVKKRGEKIKVPVYQGSKDKVESINTLSQKEGFSLEKTMFVGNDLNDYRVMQACAFSACPSDSHPKIKKIATYVLETPGGYGVVRELCENILNTDVTQFS